MKGFKIEDNILHEDANYLAVNKPPGFPTLSDRTQVDKNLYAEAKKYCKNVKICHRLDKSTSGVIIFAKNKDSQRFISRQFARKEVYKEYHAVCNGQHNFQEEIIRGAIYTSKSNKSKINLRKGKSAKTIANTLEVFREHSLIKFNPLTGRTHQIRVHAACRKAFLVGDSKYGGKDIFLSQLKPKYKLSGEKEERPIIKRVALHSYNIQFRSIDGEQISVFCDYPKDFSILLKQLKLYSSI